MADYRVYLVGSDGHFFKSVELECADDVEATVRAAQLVDVFSFDTVPGS
jgi:hypothetical protein